VDPNPTNRARDLRRNATDAEKMLWLRLRNGQLGFKFRRQCPIGPYIADFCCKERKLIIELDGDSTTPTRHATRSVPLISQRTVFKWCAFVAVGD
jgi:very-short-patch-repair endonuclease